MSCPLTIIIIIIIIIIVIIVVVVVISCFKSTASPCAMREVVQVFHDLLVLRAWTHL